ncbi:MAG: MBOAT family protein [Lachnospiraceae bacterium]|nr:MBOAT family protein [Lachnospiraceae bacterium]
MVFSGFAFIIYFLPVFLFFYFFVPAFCENAVIFIGSLIFYYYGVKDNPEYLLLMLLSIAVNYAAARMLARAEKEGSRKLWLGIGLTYNFGCLFIFKYLDFILENLNLLGRKLGNETEFALTSLVLPIGISFYTFQISSYLIDVYRKEVKAEPSFLKLGTYLCMFPQLIAGPIVTYSQVHLQLGSRTTSWKNVEEGMREFTIGLASKVLLANRVGGLWTQVRSIGFESISTPLAWLGIIAYSFQIYFDFYGYSLMAKGLGRIMGFTFPDNFRQPYLAKTMTDFWRRWHITLGSWFREYVYIPLGGNKKRTYFNLLIVWLLTGLWHGASWNFLIWGLVCFALIALEKAGLGKVLNRCPVLGHGYMIFIIPLFWLIFAVTDLGQLGLYFTRLFPFLGDTSEAVFAGDYLKYLQKFALPLVGSFLFCIPSFEKLYQKKKNSFIMTFSLVILFWLCMYSMYKGLDDPFLYYQF